MNIIIYGATSAIAQAVCRKLAERGDKLFLVGRREAKLLSVAQDLEVRYNCTPRIKVVDFCDQNAIRNTWTEAATILEGVDAVLVAHGILPDEAASRADPVSMTNAFQANFFSAASVVEVAANHFEQQRRGVITVITSVAGDRGRQSNYIYGSSKAALSIYLQGLRQRLHPSGVAVVDIKPGFVDTPMTAHLNKKILFTTPEIAAKKIVWAIDQRRSGVVYVPWFWFWIMLVIRLIPETLFMRMKL